MKFVHLHCLQHWMNSKRTTKKSDHVWSFSWKNMDCELCKTTVPDVIQIGEKSVKMRVMNYELPEFSEDTPI